MSYTSKLIASSCVLFAANVHAVDFFLDALYWQALETVDWALTNSLTTPSQIIAYQTVNFNYEPGFRVGVGYSGKLDSKLYYTWYYNKATNSAAGNLTSTFLGGKVAAGSNAFYAGQVVYTIKFNMIDWDLSKPFYPTKKIMFRPVLGLRGGWIYQSADTSFQGTTVSLTENVNNNFNGIGPKAAIETAWKIYTYKKYSINIFANLTTSYLYGNWKITDKAYKNDGTQYDVSVGSRNFGAFTLQAILGFDMAFKRFDIQIGYEIADWFDQYQVLDDGTGAHNSDLILQGLTLRLAYNF